MSGWRLRGKARAGEWRILQPAKANGEASQESSRDSGGHLPRPQCCMGWSCGEPGKLEAGDSGRGSLLGHEHCGPHGMELRQ